MAWKSETRNVHPGLRSLLGQKPRRSWLVSRTAGGLGAVTPQERLATRGCGVCAPASRSADQDHNLPLSPCLLAHQLPPVKPPPARAGRGLAREPGAAWLPREQLRFAGSDAPEQAEMPPARAGGEARSCSPPGQRPVSQPLRPQGGREAWAARSGGRIISHPSVSGIFDGHEKRMWKTAH